MASAGIGRSVEGTHAVLAALRAGRVRSLRVERSRQKGLAELLSEAEQQRVQVQFVDDVREHAETTAPQDRRHRRKSRPSNTATERPSATPAGIAQIDAVSSYATAMPMTIRPRAMAARHATMTKTGIGSRMPKTRNALERGSSLPLSLFASLELIGAR